MTRVAVALAALAAALVAAPAALAVSPEIYVGVATSYNTVRIQPTEPVDPASVQPQDFFLTMAGVDRTVSSASASPDGQWIYITSPNTWLAGQAGLVHLTAPGALVDRQGNPSQSTADAHVGGAPADTVPPVIKRLTFTPSHNICTRSCRRPGTIIDFGSTKDGFTYLTVKRGARVLGIRKFLAKPGDNYLHWDGRVNGRPLARGSYRAYIGVQDVVGNVTPPDRQPFKTITVSR